MTHFEKLWQKMCQKNPKIGNWQKIKIVRFYSITFDHKFSSKKISCDQMVVTEIEIDENLIKVKKSIFHISI